MALLAYVVIFNLLPKERAYRLTYHVTKAWGMAVCAFTFCRVRVHGAELLDDNKAYILVSNHISIMDIPVCQLAAPLPFSFLAKEETKRIPVVGFLVRHMHVAVNRRSEASRRRSFDNMVRHVRSGRSILVYVEGTRNRSTAPLQRFYDGAFRLAVESGTPLAVLTIVGSDRVVNPRESFGILPFGRVDAYWEAILPTAGMTAADVPALKTATANLMLARIRESAPSYGV
jgi:1-acyl-sn-glycerol-3-phosphate acyltransferase